MRRGKFRARRAIRRQHGVLFVPPLALAALSVSTLPSTSGIEDQIAASPSTEVVRRVTREIERAVTAEPAEAREMAALSAALELREDELDLTARRVREVVRRGDTFSQIADRVGVGRGGLASWIKASIGHADLRRLRPGQELTFSLDQDDQLAALEVSGRQRVKMHRAEEGIAVHVEELEIETERLIAAGKIRSSLYQAAVNAGSPDTIVSQIADIFGWTVDFSTDLRRGDTFRILYENEREPDGTRRESRVIAAELQVGGKHLSAFYFVTPDGKGSYYSADGRPIGGRFLRYPVEFTRISSRFSKSRFHPVLRKRRAHLGVDFAAPTGTPVRAIASGKVVSAGWHGGNGRYVKISHGSGIDSSYSHLRAISSGVRRGSRVDKGQVIGRVGSTGLATGPHLHFALWRNGKYVNPLKLEIPAAPPLKAALQPAFARVRGSALTELAAVEPGSDPRLVKVAHLADVTAEDEGSGILCEIGTGPIEPAICAVGDGSRSETPPVELALAALGAAPLFFD